MYTIDELKERLLVDLKEIAQALGVANFRKLAKQDLIYRILDQQSVTPPEKLPVKKTAPPRAETAPELVFEPAPQPVPTPASAATPADNPLAAIAPVPVTAPDGRPVRPVKVIMRPGDLPAAPPLAERRPFDHQFALIDRFLREKPRLRAVDPTRPLPEKLPDLAHKSTRADEIGVVSESMARILARQGKTARAVAMYEQLQARLPEKAAIFAAQIAALRGPVTGS